MNWTQDLRFAFRMIRKNPWFSAAIVVTLALGMGVNTTVFSLVNGVLYKPLPFPGGERLVMVGADNASRSRPEGALGPADGIAAISTSDWASRPWSAASCACIAALPRGSPRWRSR